MRAGSDKRWTREARQVEIGRAQRIEHLRGMPEGWRRYRKNGGHEHSGLKHLP